jgi:hypothetical protein
MIESISHFATTIPKQEKLFSKETTRTKAYEKSQALFREKSFKEEDFILDENADTGVYSEEMVQGHLHEVSRLDALFEKEQNEEHPYAKGQNKKEVKQYGDIFEAILLDMIARGEWFGEDVYPIKTAKFDDYKNGVDILVDLKKARVPLALAIDVTFGFQGMHKKLERIKGDIERDKLGFVRYYRSKDGSYEGKVNNVARVVVGVEMDTVQKMAQMWVENDDEPLKKHFAQTLILSEIVIQLREYARYAQSLGHGRIARVYEAELAKVEHILAKKPDEDMEQFDRVYDCIVSGARSLNAQKRG